jgi:hypothetical protein
MTATRAIPGDNLNNRVRKAINNGLLESAELVPHTDPQQVVMRTTAGDVWTGRWGVQAHAYLTGLHHGSWVERRAAQS